MAGQTDISIPRPSEHHRVQVSGDSASKWRQGVYEVYHLSKPSIQQGNLRLRAAQAVIWIDSANPNKLTSLIVYLEDAVVIEIGKDGPIHRKTGQAADVFTDHRWFGRLSSRSGVQFTNIVQEISPDNAPKIFQRGIERLNQESQFVKPVQYVAPQAAPGGATVISPITGQVQQINPDSVAPGPPPGTVTPGTVVPGTVVTTPQSVSPAISTAGGTATTNVQILSRNPSLGGSFRTDIGSVPGEQVLIYTGGARVNIDSTRLAAVPQYGQPRTSRLAIQADNVVAWVNPIVNSDGTTGSRYEIYLEGNVIFSMGNRVVYADRMYYDTSFRRGTILNADLLTPIPSYQGLVRLKADVVQQLDDNNWQAFGAALTSSRLGVPRYWLQSNQVNLNRGPSFDVNPVTGDSQLNSVADSVSGQADVGQDYFAESRSNFVYLGGVPVFYWPFLRTNLNNPSFYVERVRIGNDNIFGVQLGVGLDLFQILGVRNPPANARWIGLIDYLQNRGVGFGTELNYRTDSFWGYGGEIDPALRAWFINDGGLDNLGRDRRAVPLDEEFRGRVWYRHRQALGAGTSLRAEVGWLSDQNFLQQYYEREWDEYKDYTTGLWFERNVENRSFNIIADIQINDFFAQTSWLPRFDHFILGQSVLFDRAVWHGHSMIGYGRFRSGDPPTNPVDFAKYDPLAWETVTGGVTPTNAEGVVAGTRQELDFPFQLGSMKVVPYLLGDASYWQQDLAGNDLFRAYGQAGLKTSVPFWRVDPTIHSTLLNLNGLAHKVTWESELLYADASQNLDRLPLYNPLDDDAQEFFRRRFAFDTFGITQGVGENTPLPFDERFFAHRFGMQSYVTSPAMEIADDLTVARTGFRNRWQTKRGLPGEARIIDWVTLDMGWSWFPDADRDNFGSDFGLFNYNFAWHLGDRFSLLSDGYADFFSQGLRTASFGAYMSRPGVGNAYLGYRTIEGPISSNVVNALLTYRMSDKWILLGGSSFDFGPTGNIGQTASVIRVGESFLVRVGINVDASRGNFAFIFGFEPRFLPGSRWGTLGGKPLLPAGTNYLE